MNRLRKTINLCVNCYNSKPYLLKNHLNKIILTLVDGPFKFVKRFAVKVNQGPRPPIS